jgi:hypothetical protein
VDILFASLRVALFGETLSDSTFAGLSDEQWSELSTLAARQGVLGIVYDVVSELPKEQQPPRNLNIRWALSTDTIENRYRLQFDNARLLADLWAANNIKTLVLKGFSLSRYYPIPEHRECGDFDCYLFGKYEEGNRIAAENGAEVNTDWYKHSQIYFRGTLIENHLHLVTTRIGKQAKQLNRILVDALPTDLNRITDTNILLPSPLFNALFVTYHSFSHFVSESITLRHICDWTFFMRAEQNNFDWDEFYTLCRQFKFDRFVDVSNEIATRYFGLEINNPDIIKKSQYTDRVLNSILYDDSKIFCRGKGKWHNRLKAISNMFQYRWKYTDIARSNNMYYLWNTVWGFISKRDRH